jgi:hypothetical protein
MDSFQGYKGIEVSGRVVFGLVQAFGQFKALAGKLLLAEGIGQKGADDSVIVNPEDWYPFDAFLRALANTGHQMGDSVLHQIGVSMASTVQWPPGVRDIQTLAQTMDMSYHLHHRRHGIAMGDPASGRIKEGIGHYLWRPRPDGTKEVEISIPYPCAFDKGLMFGALRKLGIIGAILHDESLPCRKRGDKACVYVVRG